MRYLLIVDADKRKLASTSSAPFKTVSEAIAWADDIASSIKSVDGLEEKVKLHPGDVPATKALADECFKLGRFERAVELYEPLIPMLPKESVVDTRIRFVQAVWATEVGNAIHKAQTDKDFQNFGSHLEKTRAHFNALLDDLLAAKDERTFELVADDDYPMMMMLFDDAGLDAVEKILKAFPDHKDAGKLRVQTASMAIFNEDDKIAERGKKMLEDFVKNGKADDPQVKQAQQLLSQYDIFRKMLDDMKNAMPKEADDGDQENSNVEPPENNSDGKEEKDF